jgi:chromosome segregation ATPase
VQDKHAEKLSSAQAELEVLKESLTAHRKTHGEQQASLKEEHAATTRELHSKIEQLQVQAETAKSEDQKAGQENDSIAMAKLQQKIAQLEESHAIDTSTLSKEHAQEQAKLHDEIKELEERLKQSEEAEFKMLQSGQEVEGLRKERDEAVSQLANLQTAVASSQSQVEELKKDLIDAQSALQQTQESFAVQIEEMAKNSSQEAQVTQEPATLPPDLEKLHQAHNEKVQTLVKLSKERIDAVEEEIRSARASAEASQRDLEIKREEGEKLAAKVQHLEEQLSAN